MAIEVFSASDAAFDTIAARISGRKLIIRTPNQYISMFWFGMAVLFAVYVGLYYLGYFDLSLYLWFMPMLIAAFLLVPMWLRSTCNQRVVIGQGKISIMSQVRTQWVTVKTIPVEDVTAIKLGVTGNHEVVSTDLAVGSSAFGFLSVAALGVGWIATASQKAEVAIFFLHIVTKKGLQVVSLMNYSRSASDKVLLKIQEFYKQGLAV